MIDLVATILHRQRLELGTLRAGTFVPRIQTQKLKSALASPLIKVMIGPRRAGKSRLCLEALDTESFAYINLEDESLPQINDGDVLVSAMEKVYGQTDYLFFDEIQNFPNWERFLNRLHRLNKNLIVTGSNSQLLSDELASSLTGRHVSIELLPLSYREIEEALPGQISIQDFLKHGGFPEVVLNNSQYAVYLATLWEAVVLKDIVKRKKVRQVAALSNILSLFLTGTTSRYNYKSLAKLASHELSAPTVKKFIEYATAAYLACELSAFAYKQRVRLKSDRKAYTIDNGFFTAKNIGFSANHGTLLENAVFCELRCRGYIPNQSLFYYVTHGGYEVDFLLRDDHKNKALIQVCYSLGALKTKERELRALSEAAEELDIKEATVITMNEAGIERMGDLRIEVAPVESWLMT